MTAGFPTEPVHLIEPALDRVSGGMRYNHAVARAAACGDAGPEGRGCGPARAQEPTGAEASVALRAQGQDSAAAAAEATGTGQPTGTSGAASPQKPPGTGQPTGTSGAESPPIILHSLPGAWPEPTPEDEQRLRALLAVLDGPVVLDGLIGCSLRNPVQAASGPLVQLVHLPLGREEGPARERERACLQAADGIVVTSWHAAGQVAELYGLSAAIASPGADPRPQTQLSEHGNRWLCIGSIEERKNQVFLAEVFAEVCSRIQAAREEAARERAARGESPADDQAAAAGGQAPRRPKVRFSHFPRPLADVEMPHLTIAGPVADPAYDARLDAVLATLPAGTFTKLGELTAEEVDAQLAATDLLLMPSSYETFGMVISEAAAAGVPAYVSFGTGAAEALEGGHPLRIESDLWIRSLTGWLTDTSVREMYSEQAVGRRHAVPRWTTTAHWLLAAVDQAASGALRREPSSPERHDWLDMRRTYDLIALFSEGHQELRRVVPGGVPADRALRIWDLGSGTGNFAGLADEELDKLGVLAREWLLIDEDTAALTTARARLADAFDVRFDTVAASITDLPFLLRNGMIPRPDLILGNALLDVLRDADLETIAELLGTTGASAWFTLSVNGRWRLDPPHPADEAVNEAFAAHQLRDGRLGPHAAQVLRWMLKDAGRHVSVTSGVEWPLDAGWDRRFLGRFLRDRVAAASEQQPEDAALFEDWLLTRIQQFPLHVWVEHTNIAVYGSRHLSGP